MSVWVHKGHILTMNPNCYIEERMAAAWPIVTKKGGKLMMPGDVADELGSHHVQMMADMADKQIVVYGHSQYQHNERTFVPKKKQ